MAAKQSLRQNYMNDVGVFYSEVQGASKALIMQVEPIFLQLPHSSS